MPQDHDHALAVLDELLTTMPATPEYLLPLLQQVQARLGFVSPGVIRAVAHAFNLSRAEVHGVVSFYHDFRHEPAKRHVLKICRAEACQSMGAEKLFAEVAAALGESAQVTLEPVYCLGNCALSPAAMIDGRLYGRMNADKALAELRK